MVRPLLESTAYSPRVGQLPKGLEIRISEVTLDKACKSGVGLICSWELRQPSTGAVTHFSGESVDLRLLFSPKEFDAGRLLRLKELLEAGDTQAALKYLDVQSSALNLGLLS